MKNSFGIEIKTRRKATVKLLRKLKPVIENWNHTIVRYCEAWANKDVPYFYNERANVSILAAAFWASGWVALEEYSAQKEQTRQHRVIENNRRVQNRDGRADLIVTDGKKPPQDIQIEAKHKWMRANLSDKTVDNKISRGLEDAIYAATRNKETKTRVACCFFPISFPCKQYKKFLRDRDATLAAQISRYRSRSDADMWFWCFPRGVESFKSEEKNGEKRYWPGLIVGLNVVN